MNKESFGLKITLSKKGIILLAAFLWFSFFVFSFMLHQNFLIGLDLFRITKNYTFLRYVAEMCIYLCGNLIVFIVPGLFWVHSVVKKDIGFDELLFYSFLISLTSLILITTVYKMFAPGGMGRPDFSLMVAFITLLGASRLMTLKEDIKRTINLDRIDLLIIAILTTLIILCGWSFKEKIILAHMDRNFSPEHVLSIPLGMQDDLMEHFGLVDSLKNHLLPYWDLEYANKFGYAVIDPPLHKFISWFLISVFGQSFAVQSANSLLAIAASYFFAWKISALNLNSGLYYPLGFLIPLLFLSFFLVIVNHAESAVVLFNQIHTMYFFVIVQFYFLIKKRDGLFLLFALLSFLTKYEACLFTLPGLIFYQGIFKPSVKATCILLKRYFFLVMPYLILMTAIGALRGDLGAYLEALIVERFTRVDYLGFIERLYPQSASLWDAFSMAATWEFFRQYILASAFLGIFIFVPHKDDKILSFSKGVALSYFVLVVISRVKRVHYISPLIFLSTLVAFRMFMLIRWKKIFKRIPAP